MEKYLKYEKDLEDLIRRHHSRYGRGRNTVLISSLIGQAQTLVEEGIATKWKMRIHGKDACFLVARVGDVVHLAYEVRFPSFEDDDDDGTHWLDMVALRETLWREPACKPDLDRSLQTTSMVCLINILSRKDKKTIELWRGIPIDKEKEEKLDAIYSEMTCTVCLEQKSKRVWVPCMHILCIKCDADLRHIMSHTLCPLCREPMPKTRKVLLL